MDREQKAAAIAEIAASIEGAQAILAVDYRGISVPQIAALRAGLSDADATFKVVKNSLTERAADQSGAEVLKPLLSGPTALAFVHGDVAAAAKAIADFGRATQLLAFKGGLMDGAAVDVEQIRALSRLPPRQLLYGQLVGVVASPVSGLVRSLGALLGGLAVALGQVRRKMESGEIAAGAPDAPEPAAEEEPAAAAAEQPASAEEPEAAAEQAAAAQPASVEDPEAAAEQEQAAAEQPASVEDPEAAAEQEQAAAEQPASVEDPEAAAEQEQAAAEQPTAEASEAQAAESETGSAGEPAQQDEHQAEASGEARSAGAEEKSAKED
jgi:large subunit ribosomal protein L10